MKAWKIGGLIGIGIIFVIYILWYLSGLGKGGPMAGLAIGIATFYTILSIIPAFIIGAIIGAISGKIFSIEKKVTTLGSKIGFLIGLAISLFIFIGGGIECYFNPNRFRNVLECFFGLPFLLYVILIAIPFVSAWVIWIIGGLIRK